MRTALTRRFPVPMLAGLVLGLVSLMGLGACRDRVRLKVKVRTADAGVVTTSTVSR